MTTWQDYWKNEGQQKNQDLLDMLRARGGVYDRQNLGRIRAEEKMAQQRGTGVGAEYNPILGKPMVKDALGGVNSADWNIGGNIASGTPVQLMGRGFGIVADAKPSKQGGDALSTGNQADRTGSLPISGGFSPTIPSDANGEDAWIAGPDGSCTLGNYAVGKAPVGSFKTLKECREAQDSDYNCEGGVCKPVAKGTGKYKSIGECEAALIQPGFTGGQCPAVPYRIRLTWPVVFNGSTNTGNYGPYLGPILAIRQQFVSIPYANAQIWRVIITHKNNIGTTVETAIDEVMAPGSGFTSWSIIDDGQPNNCGDPPKRCPTN